MLNPISTITVESALAPATSEPESASPDLFQSLIAELLEPTTAAAPNSPMVPQPVTPEEGIPVEPDKLLNDAVQVAQSTSREAPGWSLTPDRSRLASRAEVAPQDAIPFFAKKGWTRPKENAAKHPLKGADGVVVSSHRL